MKTRRNNYNFSSKYKCEEEEETEELDTREVKAEGNNIYLYSDITQELSLNFNLELKKLEKKLLVMSIEYDCPPPEIKIHINSEGGDIFSAMAMVDTIKLCKVPITTIVEGQAASAATLISVVADKRQITENSHMLIHQLSTGFWGKHNEFKDEMKNQNRLMKLIKDLYQTHTNISLDKLNNCLTKDLWWSSKFCKKNGLIDEII